jgi:hypothetical protein
LFPFVFGVLGFFGVLGVLHPMTSTSPLHRHPILAAAASGLILALLLKFFWHALLGEPPLGYDLGFYRYLFIKHAEGWPPFQIAKMDSWALDHPIGLFIFTSMLLKSGMPVDWLLGWIWNLMPVVLACVLAIVTDRRYGRVVGVLTLLMALLSQAYFDGFAAMYWKTFVSLLCVVLAFDAFERRPWLGMIFAVLAIAIHHQTGLLFGLVFASWIALQILWKRTSRATVATLLLIAILILFGGLLFYAQQWQTVSRIFGEVMTLRGASGGNFPEVTAYLWTAPVLLALGLTGFVLSWQRERWTLWQLAVIWSAVFVFGRLIFYRRFFLQLDFFLLPFAALALRDLWRMFPATIIRTALVAAILVQVGLSFHHMTTRGPSTDWETIVTVERIERIVPEEAIVIGLENASSVILRGWLPQHRIGGPGLFAIDWKLELWEKFIGGTHDDRVYLLSSVPRPVYLFAPPSFRRIYADYADAFLSDPCFAKTAEPGVLEVVCDPLLPPQ